MSRLHWALKARLDLKLPPLMINTSNKNPSNGTTMHLGINVHFVCTWFVKTTEITLRFFEGAIVWLICNINSGPTRWLTWRMMDNFYHSPRSTHFLHGPLHEKSPAFENMDVLTCHFLLIDLTFVLLIIWKWFSLSKTKRVKIKWFQWAQLLLWKP